MASSLLKFAMDALKADLEIAQPALAGAVSVRDQLPTSLSTYPAVVIRPGRHKWKPYYPDPVDNPVTGRTIYPAIGRPLYNVGEFEGTVQLWVAGRSEVEQETVEDALLAAFNADVASGRLQTTVSDVQVNGLSTGWDATITFMLGDGVEWRDELVFSERRWSFIDVDVTLPVLALRTGEYDATDLRLVFDEDLDADISGAATPADALDIIEGEEQYQVDENADLTAI